MEKWKIIVIVALLAALPLFGYFQSGADKTETPEPAPTENTENPEEAKEPPPYLQKWWGKQAPSFSFPKNLWTNTQKPIALQDLKGKVVLLELWRANCQHCQEAMPYIEAMARQYEKEGLVMVGIHSSAEKGTIEYDWKAIQKLLDKSGVKYPVAYDEKRVLFEKLGAKKFPTFIVIDREGIIRYAHEGMTIPLKQELEAAIKQVLVGKNPEWPPSKAEGDADAALKYAPDKT